MDGTTGILFGIAVVYFLLFYFLKVRPDRQRKKEKQEMKKSLVPGDEVTMIDGIVGTVCAVKEGTVVVETGADRVRLEYAKWGILEKGITVLPEKGEAE
jgi:preprotein translocase subunit YajC